jgi:argininosuccinate lyase
MREGRFKCALADVAQRFGESVSFDRRLASYDIAGSCAHVTALVAAGILSAEEATRIRQGLGEIENEIARGEFAWASALEDVHMNIETALTRKVGEVGSKLHTARSRNDQVALDLRLYVKDQVHLAGGALKELQLALLNMAEKHAETIMPGYTHLQRAQPISLGHYLLGQLEAFSRDRERLRDCLRRVDVLPLGSGALAGSTIVLDRQLIARELGFDLVSQNSLDAVGDRDFVAEFLFCLAMIGMHLSRLSEDFILWSTAEFGFLEFSEEFSTGSSLMPQKKNPDMAELTRAKTGRLYGNLLAVLSMLKGLPSSYNRDLQEDKEALFDSIDTITAALEVWCAMLPGVRVNVARMGAAASDPALFATDAAEYLVGKGVAFREAHAIVGRWVASAAEKNITIDQVPLSELQELSPRFAEDIAQLFDPGRSLEMRRAIGAPSPGNVAERIAFWRSHV